MGCGTSNDKKGDEKIDELVPPTEEETLAQEEDSQKLAKQQTKLEVEGAPKGFNRTRRRSSLKAPAVMEEEAMRPYEDPIKAFLKEIHFDHGVNSCSIPWTSFRRAVLNRWIVAAHTRDDLGLLPRYTQKETHLNEKQENLLRAELSLDPIDAALGSKPSEICELKRRNILTVCNKVLVFLKDVPGGNCADSVSEEQKARQSLQFSNLFSANSPPTSPKLADSPKPLTESKESNEP